tara:strand:- start:1805 stop:2872 length:1068 start_codon:yes stop_codon:yes gene_type:complete
MNKQQTFTCDAQFVPVESGQIPTRIELMPTGDLNLADERGLVGQVTDAQALITRSMAAAKGGMLPIDFGHGMDGLSGSDSRAAGWITGLSLNGDRIMANVEWSSAGEEALKGRVYRFISPTFTVFEGTREAGLILRAGLTNNPALPQLAMVASTQEKDTMPQWLKQLAAKLGMPDEADEAKITAAAEAAIDQVVHAASIVTAAGLTGPLTETAATAITTKMTAAATPADPDPAKFVPMAAFQELSAQVSTLTASTASDKAQTVVTAAMQEGKVTPALKDWATKYAASDLSGFQTWLAGAPVVVDGKAATPKGAPILAEGELTAEEKVVCAATGVSHEAFLATKQGKAPAIVKKGA